MNVRISDEMLEKGFIVIPFPNVLKEQMLQHIRSYIGQVTHRNEEDLTKSVMSLSDENFSNILGNKPFRMFPDHVAKELYEWASNLDSFLGGVQAGINYVNESEAKINQQLREDSYDIYWRCVRPGRKDIGAAHADYQFWELHKGTEYEARVAFPYDERWKIWIPLLDCVNTNSLQVIPGSHKENIPITICSTKNGLRPDIESRWLAENEQRFMCPFKKFTDCCLLFHDKLVHKGPPNQESALRISAELTIILKLATDPLLV